MKISLALRPGFEFDMPLLPLIEYVVEQASTLGITVYLVGGYVRDTLLGQASLDLDLMTESDAHRFANLFAQDGQVHLDRFGTAHWTVAPELIGNLDISTYEIPLIVDFATARTESYPQPAALPVIDPMPASIAQDLQRRDFTINALALRLPDLKRIEFPGGSVLQLPKSDMELIEVPGGLDDLRNKQIRVLHDRSFIDDPTRIFRAARYATRFNFQLEPQTEALIAPALQYINHLSGERIAEEFRRIFDEANRVRALNLLQEWGVLHQIDPTLHIPDEMDMQFQRLRVAEFASEIIYWCVLLYPTDAERILKRLELSRLHIDSVLKTQKMVTTIQNLLPESQPSVIVKAIEAIENREQVNQIVCEAAWAILRSDLLRSDFLLEYRGNWRNVRPTLTGEDFIAAGLRPGPLFGTMLDRLRTAWLDGEIRTVTQERALFEQLKTMAK